MAKGYESIICISDLQAPFHHIDSLDFLYAVKQKYYINNKKTKIINQGDEIDAHALGKWGANPDGFSAGHEHQEALLFMHQLYDIFPVQDFCISNHTIRPLKRAFAAGIPKAFLREYSEFMEAPKECVWRQNFVYNNIKFEHGENVSGKNAALNAAEQNRMSTSIGHQHTFGGVIYSATDKDIIFGLNTGCLIDVEKYAFEYGKALRKKPTLGIGVILDNVPFFIPMVLDKKGRWNRKIS